MSYAHVCCASASPKLPRCFCLPAPPVLHVHSGRITEDRETGNTPGNTFCCPCPGPAMATDVGTCDTQHREAQGGGVGRGGASGEDDRAPTVARRPGRHHEDRDRALPAPLGAGAGDTRPTAGGPSVALVSLIPTPLPVTTAAALLPPPPATDCDRAVNISTLLRGPASLAG